MAIVFQGKLRIHAVSLDKITCHTRLESIDNETYLFLFLYLLDKSKMVKSYFVNDHFAVHLSFGI